LLRPRERLV